MEPKIVREEIITIKTAQKNPYGDLIINGEIKISKKRENMFDVFQIGAEVKLGYASYMNKDYIATAEQTGKHTIPKEESHLVEAAKKAGAVPVSQPPETTPKTETMTKDEWNDRDLRTRKSIERQKALELAVTKAPADCKTEDIIKVAKRFETYLEKGE